MISVLAFLQKKNEDRELHARMSDGVAMRGDDRLDWQEALRKLKEAEEKDGKGESPEGLSGYQFGVIDVCPESGRGLARNLRQENDSALMLLVADMSVSPMTYMNAAIRAEALLMRPWTDQMEKQVVSDLLDLYYDRIDSGSDDRSFLVETTEGKIILPYKDIYYFEARNKKIYVRTADREYGIYSTLEKLQTGLPDYFLPCHRSYVINTRHMVSVQFADNLIYMDHDIVLPLSRTYRKQIRELVNESKIV